MDAYSKITKLYGIKNITTEEVMDKLDMFQAKFGKYINLVGVKYREFKLALECSLTPKSFRKVSLSVEYDYN